MTFDRESGVREALRKDQRKFVPLPTISQGQGRRGESPTPVGQAADHSGLGNLTDDDHTIYLRYGTVEFSDQRTVLTAATGPQKWVAPFAFTVLGVQLAVGTVPTGADLIVDVNKGGTTLFTTQGNRPTVPAADADGIGAVAVPDVTAVADGDYLTVDRDQIGSTIAGGYLTVIVEYER